MERALLLLSPLDVARRSFLTRVAPFARGWLVDRDRRVAMIFSLVVVTSLVGAAFAPIFVLAFGPIVLGVPHLLVDVRYLVIQPGLHKRRAVWMAMFVPLALLGATADARWGWVALFGAAIASRGSLGRRALLAGIAAGLFAISCIDPYIMAFVVAHGHNLVAVAALWVFRPRKTLVSLVPFVLFVVASAFVLLGGFAPLVELGNGFRSWGGVDLDLQSRTLAPFQLWELGDWPARLVVFYAFAQSVHYGIWLRVAPEEGRPSKTPRSFTMSARALVRDCGPVLLAVTLLLALGLAAWAAFDLVSARNGYFRFAMFHGYLEFAVLGLILVEGRKLSAPREPASTVR